MGVCCTKSTSNVIDVSLDVYKKNKKKGKKKKKRTNSKRSNNVEEGVFSGEKRIKSPSLGTKLKPVDDRIKRVSSSMEVVSSQEKISMEGNTQSVSFPIGKITNFVRKGSIRTITRSASLALSAKLQTKYQKFKPPEEEDAKKNNSHGKLDIKKIDEARKNQYALRSLPQVRRRNLSRNRRDGKGKNVRTFGFSDKRIKKAICKRQLEILRKTSRSYEEMIIEIITNDRNEMKMKFGSDLVDLKKKIEKNESKKTKVKNKIATDPRLLEKQKKEEDQETEKSEDTGEGSPNPSGDLKEENAEENVGKDEEKKIGRVKFTLGNKIVKKEGDSKNTEPTEVSEPEKIKKNVSISKKKEKVIEREERLEELEPEKIKKKVNIIKNKEEVIEKEEELELPALEDPNPTEKIEISDPGKKVSLPKKLSPSKNVGKTKKKEPFYEFPRGNSPMPLLEGKESEIKKEEIRKRIHPKALLLPPRRNRDKRLCASPLEQFKEKHFPKLSVKTVKTRPRSVSYAPRPTRKLDFNKFLVRKKKQKNAKIRMSRNSSARRMILRIRDKMKRIAPFHPSPHGLSPLTKAYRLKRKRNEKIAKESKKIEEEEEEEREEKEEEGEIKEFIDLLGVEKEKEKIEEEEEENEGEGELEVDLLEVEQGRRTGSMSLGAYKGKIEKDRPDLSIEGIEKLRKVGSSFDHISPKAAPKVRPRLHSRKFPQTEGTKNVTTKPYAFHKLTRSPSGKLKSKEKIMSRKASDYIFIRDLGKGSFCLVKLVENVVSREQFALKIFEKEELRKVSLHQQFRRRGLEKSNAPPIENFVDENDPFYPLKKEIVILKKCRGKYVVQLVEVMDDPINNKFYLVLEYMAGGVLCHINPKTGEICGEDMEKKRKPFTEKLAKYYFRQLLIGVRSIHQHGIAHRDLKPDNILLTKDRKILKISDFGLSEFVVDGRYDPIAQYNRFATTMAFNPPELIRSRNLRFKKVVDISGVINTPVNKIRKKRRTRRRSMSCIIPSGKAIEHFTNVISENSGKAQDVWSMGCILYLMVFGKLPFFRKDDNNRGNFVGSAILEDELEFPEDVKNVTYDCKDLISRLLTKNMHERIEISGVLKHPWLEGKIEEEEIDDDDDDEYSCWEYMAGEDGLLQDIEEHVKNEFKNTIKEEYNFKLIEENNNNNNVSRRLFDVEDSYYEEDIIDDSDDSDDEAKVNSILRDAKD